MTRILTVKPNPTGQRLGQLIDDEHVPRRCLPIAGETRESFSVHELSSGPARCWSRPTGRCGPAACM